MPPSQPMSSVLRSSLRQPVSRVVPRCSRAYATQPPPPKPTPSPAEAPQSNVPLYMALGGLAGLGAWYAMGGFGDKPPSLFKKLPDPVRPAALSKDAFIEFRLKEKKNYNHDSATLVFEIPEGHVSGLNVASAVVVKGAGEGLKDKDGKNVIRPYTPISAPDEVGQITFLIKKYAQGNMSKHMVDGLQVGDKLAIKGPIPKWPYKANEFDSIALLAGGSGITPMWQLVQKIAADPSDKTRVTLLYTNKTEADILLREQFDAIAAKDARFKVVYGLDKAPKGFSGFTGYMTPELLSEHLPLPGLADKIKIFVCGPPPQVAAIAGGKGEKGSQGELKGLLADLGYQPSQVYKF